ncbi:hypothetical protein GCM10012320_35480 [Sinomonas cellulolyticus]|nr:hypothetical protein GCM10012320_35480 [Sinomonas sp. KCTC 49339]
MPVAFGPPGKEVILPEDPVRLQLPDDRGVTARELHYSYPLTAGDRLVRLNHGEDGEGLWLAGGTVAAELEPAMRSDRNV